MGLMEKLRKKFRRDQIRMRHEQDQLNNEITFNL